MKYILFIVGLLFFIGCEPGDEGGLEYDPYETLIYEPTVYELLEITFPIFPTEKELEITFPLYPTLQDISGKTLNFSYEINGTIVYNSIKLIVTLENEDNVADCSIPFTGYDFMCQWNSLNSNYVFEYISFNIIAKDNPTTTIIEGFHSYMGITNIFNLEIKAPHHEIISGSIR